MGEMNEIAKNHYTRVVEIVTGNEYATELEKMGVLLTVVGTFADDVVKINEMIK